MKARLKAVTIIILSSFLYSNILWAIDVSPPRFSSGKDKLASRSNVPSINKTFLPLVKILIEKIRKGELNERKLPSELIDLWRIAMTEELIEYTEEVELSLTPEEIDLVEQYIEDNPEGLFRKLLESILPDEEGISLFKYHPSSIVNRVADFGRSVAEFDYQRSGDYPKALAKLEKALTVYAVGYKKARRCQYGSLVVPAGMPAVNMMVDSAIRRKGLGLDAEIIVIEPPYGCTKNLFESWQRRVKVHSISIDEVEQKLPGLINDKTAIIYGESITNPNLMRLDIEQVLRVNRGRAAVLIDDTFATPEMVRSLDYEVEVDGKKYSVDMVMLGLTKGMSGTGNIISGAVTAKKEWLDLLSEHRNCLPEKAEVERALRGLRYLEIRFAAQSRNAQKLIAHVTGNRLIFDTVYPGNGHMIYFVFQKLINAIDNINLLSKFRTLINAVSLGQVRTLMERPSGGTHITVAEVYRKKGGISPAGIRGSAGLESIKDIQKEIDALMEILALYGDQIPEEDLDDINRIFMAEYVTQEEGKKEVRYLLPKWPIPNADFNKLISDLSDAERERLQGRYDSDVRFKEAVEKIIRATEITDYDPVTIAIHHRLFWCLLSGDHASVISSPIESTTAHKASDKHMEETFISILLGKKKGLPPIGNFSLYSRLGRPGIVTLELLMALLEVGAEKALNYDYISTSFYSERMAQKALLEQQAEIVVMNAMIEKFNRTAEELETLRQQMPEEYYRLQAETRKDLEEHGREIIIITQPGSVLCKETMRLMQNYPVKFRILTPDESMDIKELIGREVSDKTALVYFDYLRFRKHNPKEIKDVVRSKNPKTIYGITDSFNLGYNGPRAERDFDFITHVIYYEDSDNGAVVIVKNDKSLVTVWNNLFWTRKNRGTAMSEDLANIAMWYFLPYLRIFDERFDENLIGLSGIMQKIAEIKRLDTRHLEVVFSSREEREAFLTAVQGSNLVDTYGDLSDEYFYVNEWSMVKPSGENQNSLIFRVGIENTVDLLRDVEGIVSRYRVVRPKNLIIKLEDGFEVIIPRDNIICVKTESGSYKLIKDDKELNIRGFSIDGRRFTQIGSRIYEINTGAMSININDILADPLLWLGNAELVGFAGEEMIKYPEGERGHPKLMLVEWNEKLRGAMKEPQLIDEKYILNAYQKLKDPELDPILRAHYSIVVYFFHNPEEDELPVSFLDAVSSISDKRANEFIYALLGTRDVIIPYIVSVQFRKLYAIIKKICELYRVEKLTSNPARLIDENAQNIAVSRLNAILVQIRDDEIINFSSIEQINKRFNKLAKGNIDLFSYDAEDKTLGFELTKISQEENIRTKQRERCVFKKRGPPILDRDSVIVEALACLCKTKPSDVVNRISVAMSAWEQDWAVNAVLEGIASNHMIELEQPQDDFLKQLTLGVGRSGFGLGGASVETETWCRDVFTNFIGRMKVIAGVFKDGRPYVFPQVYFGPKIDREKDCTGEPLIDAYNYRILCKALFSDEPLSAEQIEQITKGTGIRKSDGEDEVSVLQKVYDYYVEKTKEALKRWIIDNGLKIVMFGQVALPNENPVLYPALIGALEEINREREIKDRVVAFLRHNYFREKWKLREGMNIRIIQKNDPIEVFVESEVNAEMFEDYFGFRPTVLYEAVRFPEIDEESDVSIAEQVRGHADLKKAVDNFRQKLKISSEGKDPVELDKDIIITQPSRLDMNKRPDSTIILAKNMQRLENERALREGRVPKKVRVLFLGSVVRQGPEGTAGLSGVEKEAYDLVNSLAKEGDMDISNQIYFLGYIPQKEVIAALTFTHIMAQASDRETFGRTPMEAMASGVPIIYCRDWTYPFDKEDRQVFYALFGGNLIFTLRPGRTDVHGDWIPGERQAETVEGKISIFHRLIYYILREPDNMKRRSMINFYISRRSMFNLKNLENFMRLRFIAYFDREGKRLRFKDREDVRIRGLGRMRLVTSEIRAVTGKVSGLAGAMKAGDGRIDRRDLDGLAGIAGRVEKSVVPDDRKLGIAEELAEARFGHSARHMAEAKQRIQEQINQHERLAKNLEQKNDDVKYIFIEKGILPPEQRYILEGEEWDRRKVLLQKLFPGYLFDVYDGNIKPEMSKDNSILLASNLDSKKYDGINSRLVLIENAGEKEYSPIDALLLLAVGLLEIDKDDARGSELKAIVTSLYQKVTNDSIENIDIFIDNNFVLNIKLMPISKFDTELQIFAISLLEKAA